MRVLALAASSPYPPAGGDRLRAHHLIAGLLDAGYEVVAVALPPSPDSQIPDRPRLSVLGAATRSRTGWRRWSALVSPYPESLWARPPSILQRIDPSSLRAEVVVALGLGTARLALSLREEGIPTVIDEFSVEFRLEADMAARALTAAARARGRIDSLKTRAFEARALRRCDLVTCVSDDDARVLRTMAGQTPVEIHPSGADVAGIAAVDHRRNRADLLVFTGTLGYMPNVDAAQYLGAEILPLVWASRPTVRAELVGQVNDHVRAMIAADGVKVVGWVPDVVPYLADADLFVAPLRIGGGTRLKILEAFAAGLPVVATSKAVEGLEVENGVHALIAEDAPGLAQAILALLDDEDIRERLTLAARRLVEEKYDWRRIGADFAESIGRVAGRGTSAH
jgi:glycosyltransferase involved in cell wall biosynthesis